MVNIVFIGAGHGHLPILQQAASFARAGHQLTLISPEDFYYSGLATGVLAGDYDFAQDKVDIEVFCQRNHINLIKSKVLAFDANAKTVTLANNETLSFEIASIAVGSVAATPFDGDNITPVKPISSLFNAAETFQSPLAIVGGGLAGVEIALTLKSRFPDLNISLFSRGSIASEMHHSAAVLRDELKAKKISLFENNAVIAIADNKLTLENGTHHVFHSAVLALGLKAPDFLSSSGLKTDKQNAVYVNDKLQSISHPHIFAIGDCMAFSPKLNKAGVYAIRGAPILQHNLLAYGAGKPLKAFKPQKRYLWIMNLGGKRALAAYGRIKLRGHLAWRLKDFIDRRFINSLKP
jgi:NADH dehydrogenase FAD-containing subunit